jgi:hypothetical protein
MRMAASSPPGGTEMAGRFDLTLLTETLPPARTTSLYSIGKYFY